MAFSLFRRASLLRPITNSLRSSKFSTSRGNPVADRLHLSPLFTEIGKDDMKDCKIELVDDATWNVSSGLADAWRCNNDDEKALKMRLSRGGQEHDGDDYNGVVVSDVDSNKEDHYFGEIEDMRMRGNLFYKLDKDSKEYEEHKFDYHGRRFSRNLRDRKESKKNNKKENQGHTLASGVETTSKKDLPREIKKNTESKTEMSLGSDRNKNLIYPRFYDVEDSCVGKKREEIKKNKDNDRERLLGSDQNMSKNLRLLDVVDSWFFEKKQRTLTFNQQTAPYHEPFCLDIYVSKGSVRASIIHRVTSKVVAVSHSISKDMKFDLGSAKNKSACAAVGKVLAQRALADDIHNVVYTPRKGDRLEGKLQIVLKSVMDGGVGVKVKLKQKKLRQVRGHSMRTQNQH